MAVGDQGSGGGAGRRNEERGRGQANDRKKSRLNKPCVILAGSTSKREVGSTKTSDPNCINFERTVRKKTFSFLCCFLKRFRTGSTAGLQRRRLNAKILTIPTDRFSTIFDKIISSSCLIYVKFVPLRLSYDMLVFSQNPKKFTIF